MHAGCCGSSLYAFITIYLWVVVVGRALLWAVIVAVIYLSFLCVDCGWCWWGGGHCGLSLCAFLIVHSWVHGYLARMSQTDLSDVVALQSPTLNKLLALKHIRQYFTIPHIIHMDSTGFHWTPLDSTGHHWTSLYNWDFTTYWYKSGLHWTGLDSTAVLNTKLDSTAVLNTKLDSTGLPATFNTHCPVLEKIRGNLNCLNTYLNA